MPKTLKGLDVVTAFRNSSKGQVVLVLQGGGALGAYQVGVYQALHETGIKLNWIIGTSIGAINAGLIADDTPERRLDVLQEFWRRTQSERVWHHLPAWTGLPDLMSYWTTLFGGISGFVRPNAAAFMGPHLPLGAESVASIPRRRCEFLSASGTSSATVSPKSICNDLCSSRRTPSA
jgi:NTE family protein